MGVYTTVNIYLFIFNLNYNPTLSSKKVKQICDKAEFK